MRPQRLFSKILEKRSGKCLCFLLLFFALAASGQEWIPHYDRIGTKEGLSGEVVTAIFQDSRGFLWIGTDGQGLNRYDGNDMQTWRHSKRDSFSLCGNWVRSIMEDINGRIWVGTTNGISRLNPVNGRFDNYFNDDDPFGASHLFKDRKGTTWSASQFGLWQFNPDADKFERRLAVDGGDRFFSHSGAGTDGRLWLGGTGVTAFDPLNGDTQCFYPFPNEPHDAEKNRNPVKVDSFGNIWVFCWGGGLQRFHPESGRFEQFIWQKNPKFPNLANIPFDVEETSDVEGKRIFWLATENATFRFPLEAGAFPSPDQPYTLFRPGSDLRPAGSQTRRLLSDRSGNLWFGTTNGLYRYKKEQEYIRIIRTPGTASISQVFFTQNGEALVSSEAKNPLMILDDRQHWKKVFRNLPPGSNDGAGEICWSAVKDEETGIVYAATFHGLVAYDEKSGETRWYRQNPKDSSGIVDGKVTHILPLGKSQLLLSFWKHGLQVLDTRSGKTVWRFQEKGMDNIWSIKRLDGVIWIGTEGTLYTFDPQKRIMTDMTPQEVFGIRYYDVLKDRQGQIWVGTNYGLWRLDAQNRRVLEKFTTDEGLAGIDVNTMAADSFGRLWLATVEGFCVFNPTTRKFYPLDKEIFHVGHIWKAPNGELWLTNTDRIQILNPGLFPDPHPSRVYITGLKINEKDSFPDVPFERIQQIRLRPGQNALTFSFTAVDLDVFGKTDFRYILEGLQSEWVHAGKNRRAAFVNLPPGVYTFRVRPEDAGDGSFYDATLTVVVTDYFWQRAWFKAGVFILLTALLVGLIFLSYTRELRARNLSLQARLAIQDERNRISRDLHDDLGSGLGAIRLLSDIALSKTASKDLRARVGTIAESARDLSEKIHEIIWAANPKNDTLDRLIIYLHQYAVSLFGDSKYELRAPIPEAIPAVNIAGEHRRALFLAYKEALNNIVQHAQATCVQVGFQCALTQLEIRICDNGRGFDLSATGDSGNGIVNMRKRIEDMGGQFGIWSGAQGTEVLFRMTL